MKSIKTKLVILYILLVFLVMVVSSSFILFKFRSDEALNAEQGLENVANTIYKEIISSEIYDESTFSEGINDIFSSEGMGYGYQSVILTSDGSKVLAESIPLESTAIPVIISAANGRASFQAWRQDISSNGTKREWFEYAVPVDDYIICVRTDASKSTKALSSMAGTLLFASIIALFITGVFGLFFANTLTKPITALTRKAKDLADGNLDEELKVFSNDEIGQLTESFNYMAKELKFNIDSISTEKNKLEVILHNMNDGVLAYSSVGTLLHANRSAIELLGEKTMSYSFDELLEKYDYSPEEDDFYNGKIISVADKFVSFNMKKYDNFYDKSSGIVIVLQDITNQKRLDDMRKEFVANVSHELRTPLTIVKSYTETLIENDDLDQELSLTFLNVINGEVDRMTVLVKDLLDLSKFDNEKMDLEMKPINIGEIIEHTVNQNKILMEKKNQAIATHYDANKKYMIEGDNDRINQVFNNVLSNAIKYSPDEANINITIKESEKHYSVYIRDTGIGIPKEDLKHIFERFYRVDKARSRQMGGTGLGLAITKEIVEAHGGQIKAQSTKDVGTTMIIKFKKQVI